MLSRNAVSNFPRRSFKQIDCSSLLTMKIRPLVDKYRNYTDDAGFLEANHKTAGRDCDGFSSSSSVCGHLTITLIYGFSPKLKVSSTQLYTLCML